MSPRTPRDASAGRSFEILPRETSLAVACLRDRGEGDGSSPAFATAVLATWAAPPADPRATIPTLLASAGFALNYLSDSAAATYGWMHPSPSPFPAVRVGRCRRDMESRRRPTGAMSRSIECTLQRRSVKQSSR